MNTIAKIGVASALAMGYVSAHASITQPTYSNPGDVFLFAEVLNSSGAVVGSYAGDTAVSVYHATGTGGSAALGSGTLYNGTGDAALQQLLSVANSTTGSTLEWAVQGGGQNNDGSNDYTFVTTNGNPNGTSQLAGRSGINLEHWVTGINNTLATVATNAGSASSVFSTSSATGGVWDTTVTGAVVNPFNWYNNGTTTAITGLNTSTSLYEVTALNSASALVQLTDLGTVTLTSAGLQFTAGTGTAPPTVPLPAAVWLLGSGLLGLAGVGRRKAAAKAAA